MKPVQQATQVSRARLLITGPGEVLVSSRATVAPTDIIARNADSVVHAGIRGQVEAVIPHRGAVISGIATVFAGIVGFGGEALGPLVFARQPATPDWHGAVLIVTGPLSHDLAQTARTAGVGGIFAASAQPAVLAELTGMDCSALIDGAPIPPDRWPLPIVLAHGFGTWELRPELTQALGVYVGQPGLLAAPTDIRRGQRPELVIALASTAASQGEERQSLGPGTLVWVIAGQHAGTAGRVVRVLVARHTLPSGIRVRAARVHLENGQEVTAPVVHLLPVG